MLRVIDETLELSDDDDTIHLVEPVFKISCNELQNSTYSTIDFQIDSFTIKHQTKYISNPITVRYQLENIFVSQINDSTIPSDIVSIIQSFLPLAPNMNDITFVPTHYWLTKGIDCDYTPSDILRTDRNTKEKYCGLNVKNPTYYNNYELNEDFDEIIKAKITIDSNKENYLTYDFGEFSQIYAILLKTNRNGLGNQMIKIKIPNIHGDNKRNKYNGNEWITHCILSVASYDGWLGFIGLNILAQLIRFEFDANGAVVNELLFV